MISLDIHNENRLRTIRHAIIIIKTNNCSKRHSVITEKTALSEKWDRTDGTDRVRAN